MRGHPDGGFSKRFDQQMRHKIRAVRTRHSLIEFLRARLDEDEADADSAAEAIHFPAERIRAEVRAKRLIVAAHPCENDEFGPCDDLRFLAEIWSDHPDYREEWRP